MKIGFIGAGNMAGAIIKGIVSMGHTQPGDIYCHDVLPEKMDSMKAETGINLCRSNTELVDKADVVVLAVKPHFFQSVLSPISGQLSQKAPLIVSIAAGKTLETIQALLGPGACLPIVRVMPNVNAMIGEGVAAICGNSNASEEQVRYVMEMFGAVGTSIRLAEKDFGVFTALAGSSPAFTYLFIDALARGGVKNGLPKDLATRIAAQTVLGSARMVLESKECPWSLIDKVCSPGGTTISGLMSLEESAFPASVMKCVDAVVARDQEMSKNN